MIYEFYIQTLEYMLCGTNTATNHEIGSYDQYLRVVEWNDYEIFIGMFGCLETAIICDITVTDSQDFYHLFEIKE